MTTPPDPPPLLPENPPVAEPSHTAFLDLKQALAAVASNDPEFLRAILSPLLPQASPNPPDPPDREQRPGAGNTEPGSSTGSGHTAVGNSLPGKLLCSCSFHSRRYHDVKHDSAGTASFLNGALKKPSGKAGRWPNEEAIITAWVPGQLQSQCTQLPITWVPGRACTYQYWPQPVYCRVAQVEGRQAAAGLIPLPDYNGHRLVASQALSTAFSHRYYPTWCDATSRCTRKARSTSANT